MKSLLNGRVPLVMFQFSLSNENIGLIPEGIPEKEREGIKKLIARKSAPKGREFIARVPEVSALKFVFQLELAGYTLVDYFYQIRNDAEGKDFAIVRFVFADLEHTTSSPEFKRTRHIGEAGLRELLSQALWQIQGYLNPYFDNATGKPVEGLNAISINLASRFPFADVNGEVILRRKKDEEGRPVGSPVPIEPEKFLRITESGDVLVASA